MAYLTNRIGAFDFIAIIGEMDESLQQVSIDSRPGVTGTEFTLEAVKGRVFSVLTIVDCDNLLMADVTCRMYKALAGDDTVAVVRNGELLLDRFKVLAVTPLRKYKIASAAGNKISNQAGAMLECQWDLIAVPLGA